MTGLKVIYLIEVNMCITITPDPLNKQLLVECQISILFADDTSAFIQGDKINLELKYV